MYLLTLLILYKYLLLLVVLFTYNIYITIKYFCITFNDLRYNR